MNRFIKNFLTTLSVLMPVFAMAQEGPKPSSDVSNPFAMAMIAIAVVLLLAILIATQILMHHAKTQLQKSKKATDVSQVTKIVSVIVFCLLSTSLFAQDSTATAAGTTAKTSVQLSDTSFYGLLAVIGVEFVILIGLMLQVKTFMSADKSAEIDYNEAGEPVEVKSFSWKKLWDKFNSFRPIKEEATIDLGHNYDGIRELDNRLPPWWIYGFYITIIFAGIYLWRYHVAHSAPLSKEEYEISMQQAAVAKEAYLAKTKNNVDESNVKILTDAASLDAAKKTFTTICAACHAADGGGGVGPNLTDDYWLHGGTIQDVFKSIKYGWPDKGMRSWKDDYTPLQIEQLASYVESLHGTKPAAPKDPQGEKLSADSTNIAMSDSTIVKDSSAVKKP